MSLLSQSSVVHAERVNARRWENWYNNHPGEAWVGGGTPLFLESVDLFLFHPFAVKVNKVLGRGSLWTIIFKEGLRIFDDFPIYKFNN